MSYRIPTAVVLALASAVALTGCSSMTSDLAVLDSDRVAADELPTLEDHSYAAADVETSRYVGEYDDISLWVTRGKDSQACLVAAGADEDDWLVACGGLPIRMGGLGQTFQLLPDGAPAPEGSTRVSENVYAD